MEDNTVRSQREYARSKVEVTSIDELSDVIIYDPAIVKRLKRNVDHKIAKEGGISASFISRILYTTPEVGIDIYRYRVTKPENVKIIKEGDGVWRAKITFDECCDEATGMRRMNFMLNKFSKQHRTPDYFGNEISIGSKVIFIDRKVDGRNASANLAEGIVTGINKQFGQIYVDGRVVGFRSKNVIVIPKESKENPCL